MSDTAHRDILEGLDLLGFASGQMKPERETTAKVGTKPPPPKKPQRATTAKIGVKPPPPG